MASIINGNTYVFGKNIDTDQICPGKYLELTDHKEIASHCLEGARKTFSNDFEAGGIVVAAENFGCGSSREHAAISLKTIGVSAIIAKSFGRIFYRNGINMGIPLIVCHDILKIANEGENLLIDLDGGLVTNTVSGISATFVPISEYAKQILSYGGVKNMIKATEKKYLQGQATSRS